MYSVSDDVFLAFIKRYKNKIRTLNLNHCYWLSPKTIRAAMEKCENLKALSLIECPIRLSAMLQLIEKHQPNLQHLAFSVRCLGDITKEICAPHQSVFKHLKSLAIHFNSRQLSNEIKVLGEQHTVLDFCHNLESIYVGSSLGCLELCRPLLERPQDFKRLKHMCMSPNIHSSAQLFFYGTIGLLPNSDISYEKLAMPNVNFVEFMEKPSYKSCFKNVKSLRHLNISGSKIKFTEEILNTIETAEQLRYLNIASTNLGVEQLETIASSCRKLQALNLSGCPSHVVRTTLYFCSHFLAIF